MLGVLVEGVDDDIVVSVGMCCRGEKVHAYD